MATFDFLKEPTPPHGKTSAGRHWALQVTAEFFRWCSYFALILAATAILAGVISGAVRDEWMDVVYGLIYGFGFALSALFPFAIAGSIRLGFDLESDVFETRRLIAEVLNELRKAKNGNETAEQ